MSNVELFPVSRGERKRKERERHIKRVQLEQAAGLENRSTRHRFVRFAVGKGKDREKVLKDFIVATAETIRSRQRLGTRL